MTDAAVQIPEWHTRVLPGVALDDDDRRLCERLTSSRRLIVDELVSGLRVTARSWVGVVQLSSVRLHVVPKLAGEHLGVVRMVDWSSGLNALKALDAEHDLELDGANLLDLVALLLVRAAERITRAGVRTAYVEREDTLGTLRGRLLFERQLRRQHGRVDRLECRFDERSADIFDNQLLLAAAQRCAERVRDTGVRRRARRLRLLLSDVCDASAVSLPKRKLHYDRLNQRYAAAHELAWLVLEGSEGLDDLYRGGTTRSFAFLLDMNRVFETFVERLLGEALGAVDFQKQTGSVVRRADGRAYLKLIPDAVARVGRPAVAIPIDAKYKRYSAKGLSRDDVAQTFLYAMGLGAKEQPHALIIYPAEGAALERTPLVVRHSDRTLRASVTAIGVPVVKVLEEVETEARPLVDALREIVLSARCSA